MSPGRRQVIIRANAGILLTAHIGTNFSEIWIEIDALPFKKIHYKMSSVKWRQFGSASICFKSHRNFRCLGEACILRQTESSFSAKPCSNLIMNPFTNYSLRQMAAILQAIFSIQFLQEFWFGFHLVLTWFCLLIRLALFKIHQKTFQNTDVYLLQ